jgi:primosomal protein N'
MIKSTMEFLDILFPVNLGPLTYRCPGELSGVAEPGMIVSAPLKNRITKGIIVWKSLKAPSGKVKDIFKVHGTVPVLSTKMINLLKWMSEYYLAGQGIILKYMLPKEAFTRVKQRKKKIPTHLPSIPPSVRGPACLQSGRDTEGSKGSRWNYSLHPINTYDKAVSSLFDSIKNNKYSTFLLHAPSTGYEYSFLIEILTETKNAILLVPELSLIDNLYPLLNERFGERVCLLHSGLSRGSRSESIERILSGSSDIVLGTRSAIFAPLKDVSLIAVLHEHSGFYKQEDGLLYHGRDVAVMRGYLEKATVLLSSICPSLESLYNCRKGKYTLLKSEVDIKRPKIKIIDMRHEKLFKPYLSKKVVDAAARFIKNDEKVMFVINRRGYSTLLQCAECSYIEECPRCLVPLVFHKTGTGNSDCSRILKCHYCGYIGKVSSMCPRCKGHNVELLGAGTQRAQEDIEKLLGIKTLRLDSDASRKRSEIEGLVEAAYRNDVRIIIGTKLMTRRLGINGGFSMAAILNTDLFLNLPDFRSAEKTYQEISSIMDRIAPSGEIFIQTRMPQNYLFKYLKNDDYNLFFREELSRRKSLRYPPCARLLLLRFISKKDISIKLSEIINKTMEIIPPYPPLVKGGRGDYEIKRMDDKVEILGPSLSKNTSGENECKVLLKSSVRGALHSVAKTFMEAFRGLKDVKIKVDVDPVSI